MPDLFLLTDERPLRVKWDYLVAILEITARDYREVLAGRRSHCQHRTILLQTASDLLDIETDLARLSTPSPAVRLTGWQRDLWDAAAEVAALHRRWRVPPEGLERAEVLAEQGNRRRAEARLQDVILARPDDEPAPDEPSSIVG